MKDLRSYILESASETDVINAVESIVKKLAKQLKPGQSFDVQDKNAEVIVGVINDAIKDGSFIKIDENENKVSALTIDDYYKLHKSDYSSLTNCDLKEGDIVIVIEGKHEAEYHFDLKVGEKYLGAVSMGSLVGFNKKGYYILVNASTGEVKIITHSTVEQAVKENPKLIRPQNNNEKPYDVNFDGVTYKSEDFVGGISLEKL